jgi:hypothetical protein
MQEVATLRQTSIEVAERIKHHGFFQLNLAGRTVFGEYGSPSQLAKY